MQSRSAVYEDWPPRPDDFDAIPILRDSRERRYTYLRLSVTDRGRRAGRACEQACREERRGEDEQQRRTLRRMREAEVDVLD